MCAGVDELRDRLDDYDNLKRAGLEQAIASNDRPVLERYIDEEMAGARCILDKDGDPTAAYIYDVAGDYVIGVHGAGWNFTTACGTALRRLRHTVARIGVCTTTRGDKRKGLTLRRAAPEWYNLDCPSIYHKDGHVVWHGYTLHAQVVNTGDAEEMEMMRRFLLKSRAAFRRKYPLCA